jgi:hypothetical protein
MYIARFLRLLIGLVAFCFLVWKYAPWPARTLVFSDQNCQCRVPYNWLLKDNPTFIMEAHRPYGGSLDISAKPTSLPNEISDPAFSETIKTRLIADGHEILNESRDPFEGHAAYAYTMRKTLNGRVIYTHSINFIAGKFRYDLITTKPYSDPQQDSQLQEALNSFSLISPVSN